MNITPNIRMITLTALLFALSSAGLWAAEPNQDAAEAEAKVSLESASASALARVPGGTIKSHELEREHGRLIWSFDITKQKTRNIAEVQVDAKTGAIVAQTTETPRQQRKEALAEKGAH